LLRAHDVQRCLLVRRRYQFRPFGFFYRDEFAIVESLRFERLDAGIDKSAMIFSTKLMNKGTHHSHPLSKDKLDSSD
jgi:hypothetical protein